MFASRDPFIEKLTPIMLIHCDSTTTTAKIENCYYNGKGCQIRRKRNHVTYCISKGVVKVDHIHTNKNLADPLTKGLVRNKVYNILEKMRLMPIEK